MELFQEDPALGRYELYGTKPNGDKYLVAKVENGKTEIFDKEALATLRDENAAARIAQEVKVTTIDDQEITRVTNALPDNAWKRDVIETLGSYKGLTWGEAIAKHGKS
jgi:hypothetical protein